MNRAMIKTQPSPKASKAVGLQAARWLLVGPLMLKFLKSIDHRAVPLPVKLYLQCNVLIAMAEGREVSAADLAELDAAGGGK